MIAEKQSWMLVSGVFLEFRLSREQQNPVGWTSQARFGWSHRKRSDSRQSWFEQKGGY
jgi:hypothetical protein